MRSRDGKYRVLADIREVSRGSFSGGFGERLGTIFFVAYQVQVLYL